MAQGATGCTRDLQLSGPNLNDGKQNNIHKHDKIDAHKTETTGGSDEVHSSREGTPPPLPPRPKALSTAAQKTSQIPITSLAVLGSSSRPKAITALSYTDVQTHSYPFDEALTSSARNTASDGDENASVRSFALTAGAAPELQSMLGDPLPLKPSPQFQGRSEPERSLFAADPQLEDAFEHEFDELDDITSDGLNEAAVIQQWKSKLKHFMILSSAGKPIWTRHGSDQMVTGYIGVVQTLISFYQGVSDDLKGFTAGNVHFVVLTCGSLHLVAISRLDESDSQLRTQLEALYMQILSTLTLPVMERMFRARASTDLRRPLQGTEKLLAALADGFTKGSPSTLLSALECLKMRKSHRNVINNSMLKTRCGDLLYGLLVAGGRLVSVVRPRKHSLHPGDLHLIFNMLFEAGSVKAGGGENWIPLCLPGFNNTGYLYMYVSFLDLENPTDGIEDRHRSEHGENNEVAIVLISTNKESFFELRHMRDSLVELLHRNGSLTVLQSAIQRGRLKCTDIIPGTVLRHFLYKSRGNVQFFMPSYDPYFPTPYAQRRLLSVYHALHHAMHMKPTHPKINHSTTPSYTTIAWLTPVFELYAIAPAATPRSGLAQAANQLIHYVRKEEERMFIIGGAVF